MYVGVLGCFESVGYLGVGYIVGVYCYRPFPVVLVSTKAAFCHQFCSKNVWKGEWFIRVTEWWKVCTFSGSGFCFLHRSLRWVENTLLAGKRKVTKGTVTSITQAWISKGGWVDEQPDCYTSGPLAVMGNSPFYSSKTIIIGLLYCFQTICLTFNYT